MVVALCVAVMSKRRVCSRLRNSLCKTEFSVASAGGWVLAMFVRGSKIGAGGRTKRQDNGIATLSALWTGGVEEETAGLGINHPAAFLRRYLLLYPPFSLPQQLPQPGVLGLCWGQRRVWDSLLTWQPALIYFSLGLL